MCACTRVLWALGHFEDWMAGDVLLLSEVENEEVKKMGTERLREVDREK